MVHVVGVATQPSSGHSIPQSDTLSYVAAARMAVLCAQLLVDEAHGGKAVCSQVCLDLGVQV